MSVYEPENISDFVTGFLVSRGFLFRARVSMVEGEDGAPGVATVELLADGETSLGKMAIQIKTEHWAIEVCSSVADSLYDEVLPARPTGIPERISSVVSMMVKQGLKDSARGEGVGPLLVAMDDIFDSYSLQEGCVGMANAPDRLKSALAFAKEVYLGGVSCSTEDTTKNGQPKT